MASDVILLDGKIDWSKPTPARGLRWSPTKLLTGLLFGLSTGLMVWLIDVWEGEDGVGLLRRLGGWLAGGLVLWLWIALVAGLKGVPADPAALRGTADPRATLARDRGVFLAFVAVIGLGTSLAVSLAFKLLAVMFDWGAVPGGLPIAAMIALAWGLFWGLLGGSDETAWGLFAAARCWLALRRRTPWRLMRFLADAHQRGVLRQTGAIYQFRHTELQHRLASRP